MKRVLVGMVLAGMLQLGFASGAGAALVPPTDECAATFKTLFQGYVAESAKGGLSDKEERKLDRQMIKDTAEAGCITDAGPLLMPFPLKKYSAECVEAASAAQTLWAPDHRKINAINRAFLNKVEMPFINRLFRIDERTRRLKKQGGKANQVRELKRKRKKLKVAFSRRAEASYQRTVRIVGNSAYANLLVYYEFISLRCVGLAFIGGGEAKDPVGRVLEKNADVLFASFGRVTRTVTDESDSSLAPTRLALSGFG